MHNHPNGLALIGHGTVIDAGCIPAGVACIGHRGVAGRHGRVVTIGQGTDTGCSDPDTGCDTHATGTGTNACDRPTNSGGSCPSDMADSASADSGSACAARANSSPSSTRAGPARAPRKGDSSH